MVKFEELAAFKAINKELDTFKSPDYFWSIGDLSENYPFQLDLTYAAFVIVPKLEVSSLFLEIKNKIEVAFHTANNKQSFILALYNQEEHCLLMLFRRPSSMNQIVSNLFEKYNHLLDVSEGNVLPTELSDDYDQFLNADFSLIKSIYDCTTFFKGQENPIAGLSFCISDLIHPSWSKKIISMGGTVAGLSPNTDYVISSDLEKQEPDDLKAKKINIPVLNLSELLTTVLYKFTS